MTEPDPDPRPRLPRLPVDPDATAALPLTRHPTSETMTGQPADTADGPTPLFPLEAAPGPLGLLGPYQLLAVLRQDAFHTVYKAFEPALQRLVAVETLAPDLAADAGTRAAFLREARCAAAICHESVALIHAVGEDDGRPYLVRELVPGPSLQQRLEQVGPLPIDDVARLGRQIALGLAAAHAQGLIHGCLGPEWVLLEGCGQRIKVTGFGMGRVAGTVAPAADPCADLSSLGSLLQTLAGAEPADLPPWLEAIIARLQADNPEERLPSAAAVAEAIERHLVRPRRSQTLQSPAPPAPPRRRRLVLAAGLAGLILLTGVLAGWLLGPRWMGKDSLTPNPGSGKAGPDFVLERTAIPEDILKQAGFSDTSQAPLELVALLPAGNSPPPAGMVRSSAVYPGPVLAVGAPQSRRLQRLAISPDGRLLAWVGLDGDVHLWNLPRSRKIRSLGSFGPPVVGLAFSPDGKTIALAREGGIIHLYDAASGKRGGILQTRQGTPLTGLQFSPDGKHIAAGAENAIWSWDLVEKSAQLYGTGGTAVTCLAVSPSGEWLACGRQDSFAEVYKCSREDPPQRMLVPGGIRRLAFSADSRLLAATDDAQPASLHVWDLETEKETTWRAHAAQAQALAFSPQGGLLVSGGMGGGIRLWDLAARGRRVVPIELGPLGGAEDMAFTPDGWYLAVATNSGHIAILRMPGDEPLGPEDPDAAYHRARALLLAGRLEEGLEALQETAKAHPSHVHLHSQIGELCARLRRWEEAAAAFVVVRKHQLADFTSWYRSATLDLYTGQAESFQEACRHLLTTFPNSPNAWNPQQLAQICLMAPSGDNVQQLQSIAQQPMNGDANAWRWQMLASALAEYRKDHYPEAIQRLQQCPPDRAGKSADSEGTFDSMVLAVLSMAHKQLGDDKEALEELGQAREILDVWRPEPVAGEVLDDWWPRRLQAEMLCREAGKLLKAEPAPARNEAIRWRNRGTVLVKQGWLEEGEAAFRKAIALKADDAPAWFGLGDLRGRQEDWKEVAEAYTEGLKYDPDATWELFQLSAVYLKTGDRKAYRKTCEELLKRFGNTTDQTVADRVAKPCLILADAVAEGERPRAQKLANQTVSDSRHDLYRWFLLCKGLADYRAGQCQPAIGRLRQGNPNPNGAAYDASAFALLAMCHHHLGQPQAAQQELQKAKNLLATRRPDPARGRPHERAWHDWIHADVLVEEAEKLIPAAPPPRTPTGS